MHRRNSLHRVRMRKKRRVLRGISLGAKFMVVLVGLALVFKSQISGIADGVYTTIKTQIKKF